MATFVFLDESGDLSFDFSKTGVSDHFIITALITKDSRSIERSVKKTLRWIIARHKKHRGCLHAYHEDPQTRMRLLHALGTLACSVMVIRLNKHKVHTRLQDEKAVLYNYVANILLDRLLSGPRHDTDFHLIAAKRETNRFLNVNFRNYLQKQMQDHHGISLDVAILSPHEHKGLQAADMLSWSVFRRLQHGDAQYERVVKHLITESPLFP